MSKDPGLEHRETWAPGFYRSFTERRAVGLLNGVCGRQFEGYPATLRWIVAIHVAAPEGCGEQVTELIEHHAAVGILSVVTIERINRLLLPARLAVHQLKQCSVAVAAEVRSRAKQVSFLVEGQAGKRLAAIVAAGEAVENAFGPATVRRRQLIDHALVAAPPPATVPYKIARGIEDRRAEFRKGAIIAAAKAIDHALRPRPLILSYFEDSASAEVSAAHSRAEEVSCASSVTPVSGSAASLPPAKLYSVVLRPAAA